MKLAALFSFMLFIFSATHVAGQQNSPSVNPDSKEIEQRYLLKKQATAVYSGNNAITVFAPEQDCIAAIPLCDSVYTQTNSYVLSGALNNEIDPASSCLLSGEKNDVWYTFTVQASGILNFSITPLNTNDDYDWALFNLTGHVCSDIYSVPFLEVRCNYAPNLGCGGITGANNDTLGTCGGQNEPAIMVSAGQTYVINVSNFSTTQFGYTIDFSPGTAVIYDNLPPQPVVAGMNCTDSILTVSYPAELIDCSTIAADGSDFTVMDPGGSLHPVLAASGAGCGATKPYTSQINITLSTINVSYPGFYLLVKTGSDGNTFSDKCGNFTGNAGADTVAFVNVVNNILLDLGPDTAVCEAGAKPLLNAGNTGASFSWSCNNMPTGTNSQALQTTYAGTYNVTVTYGKGCIATDSMQLGFLPAFAFSLGNDTTICQGNLLPTLHTGISNAASYQWYLNNIFIAGASGDSLEITQPGVYVAIADSGNGGCPGIDTIVVTVVQPVAFDLGNNLVFCPGDSALIISGLSGPGYSYQWKYNNLLLPQNNDFIYVKDEGLYYLTVSSAIQCTGMDSISVTHEKIPGPVTVNCPLNDGVSNTFQWDPVPDASGYQVSMDGTGGWTVPTSGPQGTYHNTPLNVLSLYVRAESYGSCKPGPVSESLPCDIVISNILTPNQDGKNDFFYIKNLDQYPGTTVKILDRWGLTVYQSPDYKNNWDGGESQDGVYFYEVVLPRKGAYNGTLTILKK
jgi:gliding motility-associated-like protein